MPAKQGTVKTSKKSAKKSSVKSQTSVDHDGKLKDRHENRPIAENKLGIVERIKRFFGFSEKTTVNKKNKYTIVVFKDKRNEYRFNMVAPNGEKMFSSEGYRSKSVMLDTIRSIKRNVSAAKIVDE